MDNHQGQPAHPKTIAAVGAWLDYRRARGWGLSSDPEYRGFRADEQALPAGGHQGRTSHSGRRTLAAKVLATTGKVELVQLLLGHAEADHVWPYLDVRREVIRRAFEVAL